MPAGALEGRTPTPGPAAELTGTHLGPCFYLGPAVQQEPHHDHVPPAGGDVQWRDAILEGEAQGPVSLRHLPLECSCSAPHARVPPALQRQQCKKPLSAYSLGHFSPKNNLKT